MAGMDVNEAGTIMKTWRRSLPLVVFWLLVSASAGCAEKVSLPLTLDYHLLNSLLRHESFPGDNQSAAIYGVPGDCTFVRIAEPHFSSTGKLLRLELRLDVQLGSQVNDKCVVPVAWQGYLQLVQQPIFDSQTFSLSFKTVTSSLLTLSRQPASVAGLVWQLAESKVAQYLEQVRLDLAPPITELRSFLAPLFHVEARQATQVMLESLHGGEVTVGPDAVVVELLAEVQDVFAPVDKQPAVALTAEQREQLGTLWNTWDAFLVQLLTTMASQSLAPADRQILIDVLLDTRYAFVAALEQPDIGPDFVRMQFVLAWRQLAPVFRRQLYDHPTDNSLGYLAFFTAADALSVFDRMGPTLGIEISQQGLLRLAAMLTGTSTPLPYTLQLDKSLRQLLQLPPIDEESSPTEELPQIDIPQEEQQTEENPLSQVLHFLCKPAYGAELTSYAEILRWQVPSDKVAEYVSRVRAVLAENSAAVVARGEMSPQFQAMYTKLIVAMAWQESCFRQFVVKNNKLTYLLSYNQTSIGLMQINERVWRGLYDHHRLRWDISYNALAGCEITELYLRKYALADSRWQKNGDMQLLGQAVYAMYNGGPGEYKKFLARARSGRLYASDQLFLEKLQWVDQQNWQQITDCLGSG